jgi:hypothetical protein
MCTDRRDPPSRGAVAAALPSRGRGGWKTERSSAGRRRVAACAGLSPRNELVAVDVPRISTGRGGCYVGTETEQRDLRGVLRSSMSDALSDDSDVERYRGMNEAIRWVTELATTFPWTVDFQAPPLRVIRVPLNTMNLTTDPHDFAYSLGVQTPLCSMHLTTLTTLTPYDPGTFLSLSSEAFGVAGPVAAGLSPATPPAPAWPRR